MEITKEYLQEQINNLQEQHQKGTAHVLAVGGALQALQGLIARLEAADIAPAQTELPLEPKPEAPDENPDSAS